MTNQNLSIGDINKSINEIQLSVNNIKNHINDNNPKPDTLFKIMNLKNELELILNTINTISANNVVLESYINNLINDMTNSSLKDNYYTIKDNTIKSTNLLKLNIKMIRQLSNDLPEIKNLIINKIDINEKTEDIKKNIKTAILDADNEINI